MLDYCQAVQAALCTPSCDFHLEYIVRRAGLEHELGDTIPRGRSDSDSDSDSDSGKSFDRGKIVATDVAGGNLLPITGDRQKQLRYVEGRFDHREEGRAG